MEDAANLDFRHWANFDQAYLKHFFMCQQSSIKFDEVQQVNSGIAGRDAVIVENNNANAGHSASLLQRDITYADRHAALMERDNVLEALTMIQEDGNNLDSATKLMHVDVSMDRFPEGSSLLPSPLPISGMDSNHIEGKLPQRREKQSVKKSDKESTRKRKDSSAPSQPNKVSKASRKRQKAQDQQGVSNVEKIKREDDSKGVVLYETQIDMSSTASPFCSCTGFNRQCYRWGSGGWQSSCCTHSFSEYPLPMNNAKRGSRIAGRKMSGGAFKKLLEKLAGQGVDITQPIDLKDHWAKHGTNRYIIVR